MRALFLLVFLGILLPLTLRLVSKQTKRFALAWQTAGTKLGLSHEGGWMTKRRLHGVYRGVLVTVDTWSTGGKNQTVYTRYTARFPRALGLGLRLTKQTFLSGVSKFFGGQDLEVGAADFDGSVVVRGDELTRVRSYLTPARRSQIQKLLEHTHDARIDDRGVRWSIRGLTSDPEALIRNVRRAAKLATELSPEPPALEEAPGSRSGTPDPATKPHPNEGETQPDGEELRGWDALVQGKPSRQPETSSAAAAKPGFTGPETASPTTHTTPSHLDSELERAPSELRAELSPQSVSQALFASTVASFEATRRFEAEYQGSWVEWEGQLESVTSADTTLGEPDSESLLATVTLCELESLFASRKVQAVVALPADARAQLSSQQPGQLRFRGQLAGCDSFLRQLLIEDAKLVE